MIKITADHIMALTVTILLLVAIILLIKTMLLPVRDKKQKYYSTDQVIQILTGLKGISTSTDIVLHRVITEVERQRTT